MKKFKRNKKVAIKEVAPKSENTENDVPVVKTTEVDIITQMKNDLIDLIVQHNGNGKEAVDEFEFELYRHNKYDFKDRPENEQWYIRSYILTLRHVYGASALEGDLNNTLKWFMREHNNKKWGYEELEYRIHHDNYFDYKNAREYKRVLIDEYLERLRQEVM